MLLKITRTNTHGEEKECVINTDYIIGITDKHVEPTRLYDECGNLVEEKPNPKVFEIVLKGGTHTRVNEETYNKLVAKLQVETL